MTDATPTPTTADLPLVTVDGAPVPPGQPAAAAEEQGGVLLSTLGAVAPGIGTSEFKALLGLFVNTFGGPILAKHGIASEAVMTAGNVAFAAAVSVYTAARTILKLFGR